MPATQGTDLAHTLRLGVMRLARRLRAERADLSLTLSQISALSSVERHGPLAAGELAGHERVQPPSMTRILAVLEERGYVERRPHPTDGRQSLISVSPAGAELLRADRRRREAWLSRQLEQLSPDERTLLRQAASVLDRLAQS